MQQEPGKRYPYKLPELNDYDGDLSKSWLITYYAWNVDRQIKQRKRVKVTEGNTLRDRRAAAKREMEEVTAFLKNGGYTFDDEPVPIPEPEPILTEDQYSVAQAIESYNKYCQATLKKNTYQGYEGHLRKWTTYLDTQQASASTSLTVGQITEKQVRQFLDRLIMVERLSNRTHNNIGNSLYTFFEFWKKRKVIEANPLDEFVGLTTRSQKHTPFSAGLIRLLKDEILEQGNQQLWLYCCFMYYTFARPDEEIRLLKIGDIRERSIVFRVENSKGNRQESIRIPPGLEELIEQHRLRGFPPGHYIFTKKGQPGADPVSNNWFYKQFRAILTKLHMTTGNYSQYSWKPTGVIALYQACKDVKLIQRQCRHKDLGSTDKYLRELGLFLDDDELSVFPTI